MAFPQVASVGSSSETTNTTTHDVLMPSGISAGDLLLAFAFIDGDVTPTLTGFTLVVRQQMNGADDVTLMVWYKIATGTETNLTYTTGTSQESINRVYRITGAHASTAPEGAGSESADGGGATDPPSLNPANWATEDTLWFTAAVVQDSTTFTGYPTGYGLYQFADNTGGTVGIGMAIAAKENAAASEDPDTGFGNTGLEWAAVTIAIRPTAAAAAPDLTPDGIIPSVQFATQMRRHRVGKGGTHHDLFEPFYTEAESVTTDKFAPVYETVMRKIARRPPGWFAYTEVPVPADVVEHGWEFAMPQIQRRWRDRSARLSAAFLVPQSQDPLTISYQTIIGRTRIEPTYKGLSGIHPTYEGESGTNVEGE